MTRDTIIIFPEFWSGNLHFLILLGWKFDLIMVHSFGYYVFRYFLEVEVNGRLRHNPKSLFEPYSVITTIHIRTGLNKKQSTCKLTKTFCVILQKLYIYGSCIRMNSFLSCLILFCSDSWGISSHNRENQYCGSLIQINITFLEVMVQI